MEMRKEMKAPCARCLKGIVYGKEKLLEFKNGRFVPMTNPKGDVWQFGPDCFKTILKNGGRRDW
jgi:hypothetical protein